jgi:hypothetical protein
MQHAIMANLAPEAPTTNLTRGAALSANIWLLRLCRQIIVGKLLSANYCRQIFGSCSSVGKYVAPSANLALAVAPSANMWLRRQI